MEFRYEDRRKKEALRNGLSLIAASAVFYVFSSSSEWQNMMIALSLLQLAMGVAIASLHFATFTFQADSVGLSFVQSLGPIKWRSSYPWNEVTQITLKDANPSPSQQQKVLTIDLKKQSLTPFAQFDPDTLQKIYEDLLKLQGHTGSPVSRKDQTEPNPAPDANKEGNTIAFSPGSSFDQELFYFVMGPAFLLAAYPFGSNVSRNLSGQLIGGGILTVTGALFVLLGYYYLRSKRSVQWTEKELIYSIEFLGRVSQRRLAWTEIELIKSRSIYLRRGKKHSIVAVLPKGRFIFAQGIPPGESIELAAKLEEIRRQIKTGSTPR